MLAQIQTHTTKPALPPGLALLCTVLALLIMLPGAALPAQAQSVPPQLATWDVQIWPEYDQPSVLVIASSAFAPDTSFPQRVRMPLPADASVSAVAYPDATGNLLTLPWTTEPSADGQTVVFDLDQPNFVVEYYADILTPPPSRSFDLNLVAPYAVQQAAFTLRQPSRASGLQTTPSMTVGPADTLGNPTYALPLGALDAGQNVPLQVSYSKADADPSVDSTPVATASVPTAGEADSGQAWLPWVAGLLAAVLAGALTFYLVRRRRAEAASRQARRRDARKKGVQPGRQPAGNPPPTGFANTFCVQCGQKLDGNDRFCRNCGAQRR